MKAFIIDKGVGFTVLSVSSKLNPSKKEHDMLIDMLERPWDFPELRITGAGGVTPSSQNLVMLRYRNRKIYSLFIEKDRAVITVKDRDNG